MAWFDFLTFGWLKNLSGIRKDKVDIEKAKLEIEKLEEEKSSRTLLYRASLDDVKEYDPKYKKIKDSPEAIHIVVSKGIINLDERTNLLPMIMIGVVLILAVIFFIIIKYC